MIIKNEKLAKIAYWTEKTLRSGYFWAVFLPLFAFYLAYLCAGKSISFIALSFQSLAMFPWAILDSFGIAYGFGKLLSTLGIPYFIPVLICAGAFLFFVFKARTMKQRTLFILSTIFLILYILGLFGWIRILTLPILY